MSLQPRILSPLLMKFTAQDSFTFPNEILTQDSDSIYGSLDVDSYLPTLIRLKYLQKETFAEFD